jgi:HSP20 family protein
MPVVKRQDPIAPAARELHQMRNRIRRFFEEPFSLDLPMFDTKAMERLAWSPAVEASETPKEYVITAELPGISPENVEVAMSEGTLTLRGSKQDERKVEDKERTYHLWEREYGSFERTFRFPADVDGDKVKAEFTNGVLTVKVPKVEVVPPAVRTVPISAKK